VNANVAPARSLRRARGEVRLSARVTAEQLELEGFSPRRILVLVDDSPAGWAGLAGAIEIATVYPSEITLVCSAVDRWRFWMATLAAISPLNHGIDIRAESVRWSDKTTRRAADAVPASIPVRRITAERTAAAAILRHAKGHGLIVLAGTTGRRRLVRRITQSSPVPVFVVEDAQPVKRRAK
jgi:hypothetical protein